MKTITVDFLTWHSGFKGKNMTGKGNPLLINSFNCKCILGQIIPQVSGFKDEDMLQLVSPSEVGFIPVLTRPISDNMCTDTSFSQELMLINDNEETTAEEKMILLTEKCKEVGWNLEFINVPADFHKMELKTL